MMNLLLGDVVRATYEVGRMAAGGPWLETSGGVVISLRKQYDWQHEATLATIRNVDPEVFCAEHDIKISGVEAVLQVGTGEVIPGITYQFSKHELYEQRMRVLEAEFTTIDWTYQGWSNAMTFLANAYLQQEPRAHAWIAQAKRRNGSINPNKIAKIFSDLKLSVDSWSNQYPVVSEEMLAVKWLKWPRINWQEIADEWKIRLQEQTA